MREAVGPPWFVFRCSKDGTPMEVGFTEDEFASELCSCGAEYEAVEVVPKAKSDSDEALSP